MAKTYPTLGLQNGLDKLVEAGESVDQLSKELEVKKVEVATVKTNAVLEEVAVASVSANKVRITEKFSKILNFFFGILVTL